MVLKNALILFMFSASSIWASEVDSFQGRKKRLGDASSAINNFVQTQMDLALLEANAYPGCSKDRLMDAVKGRLAEADMFGVGRVEKFVANTSLIDRNHIPHAESVYQDMSITEGFALHVYGMGTIVRINNNYVGSDKLGHFFFDGHKYYRKAFGPKGRGEQKAHDYGRATEEGLFGYTMTGVFSYADLAANFHGLRFWNALYGSAKDPLTGKKAKTYFKCKKNEWVKVKSFKINRYVDASWDEAINCNKYAKPSISESVARRISSTTKFKGCPISYKKCKRLGSKYFKHKHEILHPACHGSNVSGNFSR